MKIIIGKLLLGLSFALLSTALLAQQTDVSDSLNAVLITSKSSLENINRQNLSGQEIVVFNPSLSMNKVKVHSSKSLGINLGNKNFMLSQTQKNLLSSQSLRPHQEHKIDLNLNNDENDFFLNNRRNRYSTLWAFTALNYLYADLISLMDKNILNQYQNGVVDGVSITPKFLTLAAAFMQIPLSNVFLPQVIKNERTLRWVQIASGAIMTLVQSATLFVGKPTPYYVLFSAVEIGTTAYITFDAIKWKPKK